MGHERLSPDHYTPNYTQVDPKIRVRNMKTQSTGVKSFAEIKPKLNLSPGQYNPGEAFDKI